MLFPAYDDLPKQPPPLPRLRRSAVGMETLSALPDNVANGIAANIATMVARADLKAAYDDIITPEPPA